MFRCFKSWKFMLLLALIALYLVYFGVVYKTELELPSDNWSRNVFVTQLKSNSINDLMTNENIFSIQIPSKNSFMVFWNEDNTIKYSLINNDGLMKTDKLNLDIPYTKKIRGFFKKNIIYLYSLENKTLKTYQFDFNTKEIISSNIIANSVKDFAAYEDLLIYSNDSSINVLDKTNHIASIKNIDVDRFEAVKDEIDNSYHIAVYEKTRTGQNILDYLNYDLDNKELNKYKLANIVDALKQSLERVDINVINNKINILASVTDNRSSSNTLYNFKFNKSDITNFSKEVILINGASPRPQIIKNIKDKLAFVASVDIIKGKNTETTNIVKYIIDEKNNIEEKKLLTKTNEVSLNPYYFSLGNNEYLVWTDINGNNKKILLSSNNANIINASQKMQANEIIDIFMATFTSLIPSLFLSLIPLMNIYFPTILLIFLVSVIKFNLIENYSTKTVTIIFLIHLLLKIFYSNRMILNNYDIHNFLPLFLKSPLILYLLIALTTLISLYCLKRFIETSDEKNHLVKIYSFFAFTDIIIYSFLTIPYIYSYLLFTYKVNI